MGLKGGGASPLSLIVSSMILASSASTTDDPVKALGVGGGGTEIHSSSVCALVGTERTVFLLLFVCFKWSI